MKAERFNKSVIIMLIGLLTSIMMSGYHGICDALEFTVKQINGPGQQLPAIHKNYIVYINNPDVFLYDLVTEQTSRITQYPSIKYYPNIYDNYIVWLDTRNGGYDVYGYDLLTDTEKRISPYTTPTKQINVYRPGIYGNKVVYYDNRNGNWDIWMYDLSTEKETQITFNTAHQFDPDIYEDKIVWWDFRDFPNLNVYMYDVLTGQESRISNSIYRGFQGRRVSIDKNRIVWDDERNGNPNIDIFMYDYLTEIERPICTNPAMQYGPDISGDYIVWMDKRRGSYYYDIYLYDLKSQFEYLVGSNAYPTGTNIDGNHIVWATYNNISLATITDSPMTLVDLSLFTAKPGNASVKLNWMTETEIDNAGFNLYRAESKDGEYTKINTSLISAKGSSTQGASYEYVDTGLKNRKTYYYKLEDIDLNGTATMHSPVSATPRWFLGIFNIQKLR